MAISLPSPSWTGTISTSPTGVLNAPCYVLDAVAAASRAGVLALSSVSGRLGGRVFEVLPNLALEDLPEGAHRQFVDEPVAPGAL
jgi:hypothetical protein